MATSKGHYGVRDLKAVMYKLYKDRNEDGDVTLVCPNLDIKVHSLILCPRSKVFDASCNGNFKESKDKRIELSDENPKIVSKMVCYCYSADYDDAFYEVDKDHRFVSRLSTNAQMYVLADKFDMPFLKKLAKEKFDQALSGPSWEGKNSHVIQVIPLIYGSTMDSDRGLRDIIVSHVRKNFNDLFATPSFSTVVETPEFLLELAKKLFEPPYQAVCKRCKSSDKWKADHVRCGKCDWGERC